MDVSKLKQILSVIDINNVDKEELKKELMMQGWKEDELNSVFNDLLNEPSNTKTNVLSDKTSYEKSEKKKISDEDMISIKNETDLAKKIRALEKKGLSDEEIESYLKKENYLELDIKRAHTLNKLEDDKVENYLKLFKDNIIPFIEKGYNKYYIKRQFVSNGWHPDWFDKAYSTAEKEVIYSRRSLVLEKEILHRLISGENKHHVAKALMKQGWPDDLLKKNFESLDHGLEHLKSALYEIDLNHYNKDEIHKVLVEKGWPDELVELTLNNLINKVEYHRNLQRIQNEVRAMMYAGKNSKDIEARLIDEGFEKTIIDKIIMKLNLELVRAKEVDKLKTFNNTKLKHKNYHNYDDLTSHFDPVDKNKIDLNIKESLRKTQTSK